jgi:hypothetical protein
MVECRRGEGAVSSLPFAALKVGMTYTYPQNPTTNRNRPSGDSSP